MKVLIACLATESNSFAPIPTGRTSFEEVCYTRNATGETLNLFTFPLFEWRKAAEARGWQVIESRTAAAQPGGVTIRAVFESYRDEILADIEASKPDIVLFSLHGSMIAEGYDDCEGDLIARARDIVGDKVVIGAEIDPHTLLTPAMTDNADLIVAYKEYPHVDAPDRARDLFSLVVDTVEGRIKPVMRAYDCRMICMYQTPREPIRSFVDEMSAREGKDGILSISLIHTFPWGDTAAVGTRMLVIADDNADKAAAVAEEFGQKLWSLREQIRPDWPSIPQALDIVENATAHPVVLADFADNAGGGAPSDSTFVLREALERGIKDVAFGIFWDPVVVRMCRETGVGATLNIRLGGKIGPASGDPLDLRVTVRGLKDKMGQMMGETTMEMGNGVWLESEGLHIVASDIRTQTFNPSAFTDLGIDITKMKALVVKSMQHFYAAFEPVAAEIHYIDGPGAITSDYANIPYTKRDGNYWPRVENPFA